MAESSEVKQRQELKTKSSSSSLATGIDCMKNGFLVIPFKLSPNVYHYTFVKKHQTKLDSESNGLFVVNLPLLTNVDILKKVLSQICSKFDTIAHVEKLLYNDEFGLDEIDLSSLTSDLLKDTNNTNESRFTPRNTSVLKFVDESSLNNCFNALRKYSQLTSSSSKKNKNVDDELIQWEFENPSIATFINFYKPIDIEYLKNDVYEHLKIFEQRELEEESNVQSSIVDEDGFTLVVGKNTKSLNSIRKKILNRNPLSKYESKVGGDKRTPNAIDKKAKQDFYRFQVRERKKQEINQLLNKFKEDQEKIKVMKAKRKFNPYK
ncbi:Rrp7p NDAI_0A00440 [Naumovozyma dairenensis CBS 421]|uniref:Ribosomal RNA-processing protein 7 C-terminal domain-containing protein n=1 Tax=Naumovozyma dairenensis (strain ATCC 10597 / BCRC 20456 / CBS 421 / NBRC 0211 / NRRL Y-12639) TaxID=1071378 RepID=G0W314_NAUDC|nr:hypothetical protein NDAI_0A00440 [Naumovozyma dairenensis CBS 421]CCD22202.1 hypothetical protein NDAI_0A00440 [Naumovozyma dairenensis CBS 421]